MMRRGAGPDFRRTKRAPDTHVLFAVRFEDGGNGYVRVPPGIAKAVVPERIREVCREAQARGEQDRVSRARALSAAGSKVGRISAACPSLIICQSFRKASVASCCDSRPSPDRDLADAGGVREFDPQTRHIGSCQVRIAQSGLESTGSFRVHLREGEILPARIGR
jgi:hypothetical protein